ncbi:MAG: alkaline phosphatase [Candidatus Paceibacter sp.]|jgi:membrane protein DedA with SNARE-associated domain|nr:alkaline phosphatase [Candidatus Paceibacter sp.]
MEGIIAWILAYKYIVLVPGAIIEGPVLSMLCGLLIRIGVLDLAPTYVLLMAGDLIGDTLWYWAGFHWGKKLVSKFGKYISLTEKNLEIVGRLYHKYHNSIIIISKLCMGLGFPGAVLATAGIVKIPFKKFILLNTVGQVIWTGGLLAIGYYLGDTYLKIYGGFEIFSFVGLSVLTIAILFGIGKYIRKRTLEQYS